MRIARIGRKGGASRRTVCEDTLRVGRCRVRLLSLQCDRGDAVRFAREGRNQVYFEFVVS